MNDIKTTSKTPLQDIIRLHRFQCDLDLTWGKGQVWKNLTPPEGRNSLHGTPGSNLSFDFSSRWPIPSSSLKGVLYDPPFIIKKNSHGSFMVDTFGAFDSPAHATACHRIVMANAFRCLTVGGKLVVKIQDCTIDHGRVYFASPIIYHLAQEAGLVAIDHFSTKANNTLLSPKVVQQKTARKDHVDWWVFEKSNKRRF